MSSWVRLWLDMPTDPKWRVVARKAGRPLSEVVAVFVLMMTNAGERTERESERGELRSWSDEVAAAALDVETEHVSAIRAAMQGIVLDGCRLLGWEKRQPKREDGAAERAKAWRERKRTQANAEKRPDSDPDSDTEINPTTSEQDPARESRGFDVGIDWGGVGVAQPQPPSPAAKLAVAKALRIADAEPIAEAFVDWQTRKPQARRARDTDALFRRSAEKIFSNLPDEARKRCGSLAPEIVVRNVKPSPQLVARMKGHGHG